MDNHPYHSYLFFDLDKKFYQQSTKEQVTQKQSFNALLSSHESLIIEPYATLGLKTKTTFMLWARGKEPESIQSLVHELKHSRFGEWLELNYSFFGIARESKYSGRHGNPEQTMQNFKDRLPYFVVYPFTKTTQWHQMSFDDRRQIMGEHVKVGLGYKTIRQCLLYSYGIDDYEFVVSYETTDLEKFQDLVVDMRHTKSRLYTQTDIPIFTCIHKPLKEFIGWL
jgi:chlorite dismutase